MSYQLPSTSIIQILTSNRGAYFSKLKSKLEQAYMYIAPATSKDIDPNLLLIAEVT